MFGIPTATLIQIGGGLWSLFGKTKAEKNQRRREFVGWLQQVQNVEVLDSAKLRNEMLRLEKELEDK